MNIYVGHSRSFNYDKNLYQPLRESILDEENTIVLPHEDSDKPFNSKEYLKKECDLFIAEVSNPSTGLGIELGWADQNEVPIICVHVKDSDPSSSLTEVTDEINQYNSKKNLIEVIKKFVEEKEN